MTSGLQFLDLPCELIHKVLSLLSPTELFTCQLVNKYLNSIIAGSSFLQYIIALTFAKADDNPCSVASLPQKIEDVRSSEYAWATLQPSFIASVPVKHRTSGIYDLSGGTYLLGTADRIALQYLQLPNRVDAPLDWMKINVDKIIIDMGFCVFEHDLIAVITSVPSTTAGLLDIEMSLLEYSTGRPHPKATNSTIFIMNSSTRPSLMCEIVGDNLVLILNFMHAVNSEDRIFIWNWRTSVLKSAFLAPYHSYSGILFLEENLIMLPNAKSSAFDFFHIPTKPTAESLRPIFSLQLPSLVNGTGISWITCRAEPNPIADISRLDKKQRAQERADSGMDELDPFAPKRGFMARAEEAICIFQIRFRIVPNLGQGIFDTLGPSFTLFVHRSNFLKLARQYEETPIVSEFLLPEDQTAAGADLRPRRIPWADWGPPISRWFSVNGAPSRWITTSAGQRCVMFHEDDYTSPIKVLDFNPFNIRKMKAKLKAENETAKDKLHHELKAIAEAKEGDDQHQSGLPRETEMGNRADEEDRPSPASEIGEPSSSGTPGQTEPGMNPDVVVVGDEIDGLDGMLVDDTEFEGWTAMDDDNSIFLAHVVGIPDNADTDDSMPDLEVLSNSDGESTPYTTNTRDHRHPGRALCRIFEGPSNVESPEIFAEEVEGRLPYVEYVSETDYEYDGVLLDEERILGITTGAMDRITAIDIFYFG